MNDQRWAAGAIFAHTLWVDVYSEELHRAQVEAGLFAENGRPLFRMPGCRCSQDDGKGLTPEAIELYNRFGAAIEVAFDRTQRRLGWRGNVTCPQRPPES